MAMFCTGCGLEIDDGKRFCTRQCYLDFRHRRSKSIIVSKIEEIIEKFNDGSSVLALAKEYEISKDLLQKEFRKRGIENVGNSRYCGKKSNRWRGYESISGRYWGSIVWSAKRRNIEFSLSIEDAWKKFVDQKYKCALSGVELTLGGRSGDASLDRIDSTKGYLCDNVQWVHKVIQMMKNKWSNDEYIKWCRLVAEAQGV